MIVQSDAYAGAVSTLIVAEVTKNLTMAGDPACLFIDANTPEGMATGLVRNSVLSCLVLLTASPFPSHFSSQGESLLPYCPRHRLKTM